MKVTFTCEKCGSEFPFENVVVSSRDEGGMRSWSVAWDAPCPNCAKLAYGPLTEEMVAEAVRETWENDDEDSDALRTARFVLRLLKDMDTRTYVPRHLNILGKEYRDWILKLAREP